MRANGKSEFKHSSVSLINNYTFTLERSSLANAHNANLASKK